MNEKTFLIRGYGCGRQHQEIMRAIRLATDEIIVNIVFPNQESLDTAKNKFEGLNHPFIKLHDGSKFKREDIRLPPLCYARYDEVAGLYE